jgi:hypothetical protein
VDKPDQREKKVVGHDDGLRELIAAIRQLTTPPAAAPRAGRIGFRSPEPMKEET